MWTHGNEKKRIISCFLFEWFMLSNFRNRFSLYTWQKKKSWEASEIVCYPGNHTIRCYSMWNPIKKKHSMYSMFIWTIFFNNKLFFPRNATPHVNNFYNLKDNIIRIYAIITLHIHTRISVDLFTRSNRTSRFTKCGEGCFIFQFLRNFPWQYKVCFYFLCQVFLIIEENFVNFISWAYVDRFQFIFIYQVSPKTIDIIVRLLKTQMSCWLYFVCLFCHRFSFW